jgi:hypothetical protein
MSKAESQLIEDIGRYCNDPLGFVRYAFPWSESGDLEESGGPRQWQGDILEIIGQHLRGPDRFTPFNLAVSSGHGIGKSALIAMICNWAMSTCEDCRVVMTANTEAQLRTKTWPECSKWFKLAINAHWWTPGATTISVKQPGHERLWRVDAIPWSETNTEAFAGLHNKGKRIVVLFDEGSAIADEIWQVTEGALTDAETEILWIVFGNPTRNTGRFRECFGRYKHRWITRQIDSRGIEGTNKEQLDKWIADYGEDSDFCRVRVRGEFPRAGSTQFIAGDVVAAARKRTVEPSGWKIISVDVARFGDDQTVIGLRQGHKLTILEKLRGQDTMQVAMRVCAQMKEHTPRSTVIDGDGVGAGVVDYVKLHMEKWFKDHAPCRLMDYHGGGKPDDPEMYFNARAENWGRMRAWLAEADIPDDPELDADLTGIEYSFSSKNQIQLEKKEDLKKRGLASPDIGDMMAMSFAPHPAAKTRDELLSEEIAATVDPMQVHFKRLAETERRRREAQPQNWWD